MGRSAPNTPRTRSRAWTWPPVLMPLAPIVNGAGSAAWGAEGPCPADPACSSCRTKRTLPVSRTTSAYQREPCTASGQMVKWIGWVWIDERTNGWMDGFYYQPRGGGRGRGRGRAVGDRGPVGVGKGVRHAGRFTAHGARAVRLAPDVRRACAGGVIRLRLPAHPMPPAAPAPAAAAAAAAVAHCHCSPAQPRACKCLSALEGGHEGGLPGHGARAPAPRASLRRAPSPQIRYAPSDWTRATSHGYLGC